MSEIRHENGRRTTNPSGFLCVRTHFFLCLMLICLRLSLCFYIFNQVKHKKEMFFTKTFLYGITIIYSGSMEDFPHANLKF